MRVRASRTTERDTDLTVDFPVPTRFPKNRRRLRFDSVCSSVSSGQFGVASLKKNYRMVASLRLDV
jgi:hypothetical protein